MASPQPISSVPAMQEQFAQLDDDMARRRVAQAQVQQAAQQRGGPAQLAALLSQVQQKYGSIIPASTLYGLIAKVGLDPQDPAFADIATAAAKSQQGSGIGSWVGRGIRDTIGAPSAVLRKADDATGNHFGVTMDAVTGLAKQATRTGFLAAGSGAEEAEGAFRNVAAWKPGGVPVGAALGGAAVGVGLAATAPVDLTAGVVGGAAVAGATLGGLGAGKVTGTGRWEPQSSGAIALGRAMHGEDVNLGTGWLPDTHDTGGSTDPNAASQTIGAEQTRRAQRVMIAGHAVTPGRLLLAGVTQPGSQPYKVLSGLVDADLNWHYDPAQLAAARAGNYARNADLFVDWAKAFSPQGAVDFVKAGGLFSARPTIDPEKASAWLDQATELKQQLADTQGKEAFGKIFTGTKGRLGVDVTNRLAKATTPEEVDAILRPELGSNGLRGPLDPARTSGVGGFLDYTVKPKFESMRILKAMPPGSIPVMGHNDQTVEGLVNYLHNADLPVADVHKYAGQMADAVTGGDRHAVVAAALDAVKAHLMSRGVSETWATSVTRMYADANEELRGYGISDVARDWNPPGMMINDGDVATSIANPHLMTEYQNSAIPLPNPRDIRTLTSIYGPLMKALPRQAVDAQTGAKLFDRAGAPIIERGGPGALWTAHQIGTSAMDFLQGQIWKPLVTVRGALAVRTIADAQARMAAVGLSSMFHHPLDALAWVVSPEGATARTLDRLGIDAGKGGTDAFGYGFQVGKDGEATANDMQDFSSALNQRRGQGGLIDRKTRTIGRGVFDNTNSRFHEVRASETTRLASDPVAKYVAGHMDDLDAAKAAFRGGMATSADAAATDMERNRLILASTPSAAGLANPDVADRYIQSVADRISYVAGGDSNIVDMIAHGTLDGQPLRNGLNESAALKSYMAEHADSAPPRLLGDLKISERGSGVMGWYSSAVDSAFSHLVGEPSNKLSNSPVFRQLYWQRAEELAPQMTVEAQADLVRAARTAKLDDVAGRVEALTKTGDLNLESADLMSKGFGLDGTKRLLHDLQHRSQFGDQLRLLSPFAEAWRQMISKYAQIGVEHPDAIRKVDQVITGARGSGFFHKDTQGNEVFTYPMSGWISNKLIGMPIPMDAKVKGLTLATDVLPGIGPAASMAAGALIPDQPNWDFARNLLLPYGSPDATHGIVESVLPAWMTRLKDSGFTPLAQNQAAFNSTVMDTARYLASTGKYDTGSPDGITHLLTDARQKAKALYVLRAAASFVSPSAPSPDTQVQVTDQPKADAQGKPIAAHNQLQAAVHLASVDVLVKEYHALLDDPATRDSATETMLSRYGDGIALILQGKTVATVPDLPGSKSGAAWETVNDGVVKAHPNVWGFFAPQGGELDLNAYQRQVDSGQRARLTPEQVVRLANNRVANAAYQDMKTALGPTPNAVQRAALQAYQDQLGQKYTGYGDSSGVPQKASTTTLVRNLETAAEDPRLAGQPTTKALQAYLAVRDVAVARVKAAGMSGTTLKSKTAAALVNPMLEAMGAALSQRDEGFAAMWDQVFSKELMQTQAAVPPTSGVPA